MHVLLALSFLEVSRHAQLLLDRSQLHWAGGKCPMSGCFVGSFPRLSGADVTTYYWSHATGCNANEWAPAWSPLNALQGRRLES